MSFSRELIRSDAGNIAWALALTVLIAGMGLYFSDLGQMLTRASKSKIEDSAFNLQIQSAIETFMDAYRRNEAHYINSVSGHGCTGAQGLGAALSNGVRCKDDASREIPVSIRMFGPEVAASPDYEFPQRLGCELKTDSSECSSFFGFFADEVVRLRQRLGERSYEYGFFLIRSNLDQQVVEFRVEVREAGRVLGNRAFGVRYELPNSAHIQWDGKVLQEKPDTLSPCSGSAWAQLRIYNPDTRECEPFVQMGGGDGLAYYKNRYFGFRPQDGMVIDLLELSKQNQVLSNSHQVNESDGSVNGVRVFPPHSRIELLNADDITTIDDQIFFVSGMGVNAHIGYLKKTASGWQRIRVCKLGEMGWGLAYSGLMAESWSDPFDVDGSSAHDRYSVFRAKTDSGDLLTVGLLSGPTYGLDYKCVAFREARLQQVEYRRTYGMERSADTKSYYLF